MLTKQKKTKSGTLVGEY